MAISAPHNIQGDLGTNYISKKLASIGSFFKYLHWLGILIRRKNVLNRQNKYFVMSWKSLKIIKKLAESSELPKMQPTFIILHNTHIFSKLIALDKMYQFTVGKRYDSRHESFRDRHGDAKIDWNRSIWFRYLSFYHWFEKNRSYPKMTKVALER